MVVLLSCVRSLMTVLALATAAWLSAVSTAAAGEWRRAESEHFVLYGETSESDLVERARRLEEFDAVLRRFHAPPPDQPRGAKLPIYLVGSQNDVRRIAPGLGRQVPGFYTAGRGDIFAVALRGSGIASAREAEQTLLHEYVHHFLLQNYARGYPGWLIEGVAEFFMTADFERDGIIVGAPNPGRLQVLSTQPWIPVSQLLGKPPLAVSAAAMARYYALAWGLTHYMMTDETRRRQLNAYLSAASRGETPVAAWTRVTGDTPAVTQQKLERYLRSPLKGWSMPRVAAAAATKVTVTTLPAAADDLLLYDLAVKMGTLGGEQQRYVQTLRQLAGKHPGDRLARLALGRVELRYGDAAAGEALLRDLLKQHPDDEEALQALALAKLDAADRPGADRAALHAEAAPLLTRAFKLDAEDYRTLYAYARSQSSRPDYPSENVINVFDKAVSLAPQVAEIRLAAARAMMTRRLWDEAIYMLEPVAESAHGGRAAEAAQALLQEIAQTSGTAAGARAD